MIVDIPKNLSNWEGKWVSNILFLGGVPDERQKRRKREQENKRHRRPFLRLSHALIFLHAFHRVIPTIWEPGKGYKNAACSF